MTEGFRSSHVNAQLVVRQIFAAARNKWKVSVKALMATTMPPWHREPGPQASGFGIQ